MENVQILDIMLEIIRMEKFIIEPSVIYTPKMLKSKCFHVVWVRRAAPVRRQTMSKYCNDQICCIMFATNRIRLLILEKNSNYFPRYTFSVDQNKGWFFHGILKMENFRNFSTYDIALVFTAKISTLMEIMS